MAKVANSHGSMYNGVSQQPPSMRADSQCEEMYNINTSLEYGLIRREPLEQPDGSQGTIPIMSQAYDNSYSKMIIDGNSVYQININNGIPMVVQLEPYYKVLRPGDGINISRLASLYLSKKINNTFRRSQYSTTTIKNTTIISNDAEIPETYDIDASGDPFGTWALVWFKVGDPALGIEYRVTIDGKTYTTDKKDRGLENKTYDEPYAINDDDLDLAYPAPMIPKVVQNPPWLYQDGGLVHQGTGEPLLTTSAHKFTNSPWNAWAAEVFMTTSDISQVNSYRQLLEQRRIAMDDLARTKRRRTRLEEHQDRLNEWIGQDVRHPGTTKIAAQEIGTKLKADGYTVYTDESMIIIKMKSTDASISTSDSFGNNALVAFHKDIDGIEGLPAKPYAGWTHLKFRVKQETTSDKVAFWVKWSGSVWEESTEDFIRHIHNWSMPIEMRIEFNESNSIINIEIDIKEWDERKVGDTVTNEGPSFLNRKPIRDIFFYRNRIGFLTDEGISMTASGDYSNLWRTTAMASLDSDPIDFVVSTTSSTALRYTVMNQDKIFILADNVQFVMDGGATLGPNSVQVTEVSHYVLNLDIPPIVTDNKIVMIGGSEKSTIVYEYIYNENLGIAEATALTAHVPGYILSDVTCLAASNEDDMIFVVASDHREKLLPYEGGSYFRDTLTGQSYPEVNALAPLAAYPDRKILYVYKFSESGNQKVQSAWSKWNYRGSVLQVAAARGMLYMDIDHEYGGDQSLTIIGTGNWEMTGAWDHQAMMWNMDEDAYLNTVQLQRRFARQALRPPFLEAVTGDYEVTSSILDVDETILIDYRDFGEYVNRSYVDLGEFVFKDRASKKYTAGKSQLGAVHLKSDPGSVHSILVSNLGRGVSREILPRNTKKYEGIGTATNYFLQQLGKANTEGRERVPGDSFDTDPILDTEPINQVIVGEPTIPGGSFDGAFDVAPIANLQKENSVMNPVNDPMPNLYGIDVPVFVGGRSDSTRVIISSYNDAERDYGFRIHDVIQEANVNTRFKLS